MPEFYKILTRYHRNDNIYEMRCFEKIKGAVIWEGRTEDYDTISIKKGVLSMNKNGCHDISFSMDDVEEMQVSEEYFWITLYADSSTAEWFRKENPLKPI